MPSASRIPVPLIVRAPQALGPGTVLGGGGGGVIRTFAYEEGRGGMDPPIFG